MASGWTGKARVIRNGSAMTGLCNEIASERMEQAIVITYHYTHTIAIAKTYWQNIWPPRRGFPSRLAPTRYTQLVVNYRFTLVHRIAVAMFLLLHSGKHRHLASLLEDSKPSLFTELVALASTMSYLLPHAYEAKTWTNTTATSQIRLLFYQHGRIFIHRLRTIFYLVIYPESYLKNKIKFGNEASNDVFGYHTLSVTIPLSKKSFSPPNLVCAYPRYHNV